MQGKPQPVITWTKDGQAIDTKKVNTRNSDKDSIFFIRAAERADSGVYEMCVKVDSFEDKAQLTLQIIGESLWLNIVVNDLPPVNLLPFLFFWDS